jgi:hypothetical protein
MEQNRSAGGVAPPVALEFGRDDALDVLQENNGRSGSPDPVEYVREEVSWVGVGGADSGGTERLAGEAATDDRDSSELLPRESPEVRPDRSRVKLPALHAREK